MDKDIEIIDKLLRKRARALHDTVLCNGFDADIASAYLEKALTSNERARYELHLADCHSCRKQMAEFLLIFGELPATEMIESVPLPVLTKDQVTTPRPIINPSLQEAQQPQMSLAAIWSWLFGPQLRWVTPLVLIGLIAGIVWFVVNRKSGEKIANGSQNVVTNNNKKPAPNQTAPDTVQLPKNDVAINPPTPTPEPNRVDPVRKNDKTESQVEDNKVAQQPKSSSGSGENNSTNNIKNPVTLPATQNPDGAISDVVADNKIGVGVTTGSDGITKLPPPPVENGDEKNPQKQDGTTVAHNTTLPENAGAKKKSNRFGIGLTETPTKKTDQQHSDSIKTKVVGSKIFRLVNGIWTDEQYKQGEKRTTIALEYGSAEYQRVVKEHTSLGQYFELGSRVIVVDNGTVYTVTR